MTLGVSRPSSGKGARTSSMNDYGRNSQLNRLFPVSAAGAASYGSTHHQRKPSRQKWHFLLEKEHSSRVSATIDKLSWTASQQFQAEAVERRRRGALFSCPSSPTAPGFGGDYSTCSSSSRSSSSFRLDTLAQSSHPTGRGGAAMSLSENAPTPRTAAEGDNNGTRGPHSGPQNYGPATAGTKPTKSTTGTTEHHRHNQACEESTAMVAAAASTVRRYQLLGLEGSFPTEVLLSAGTWTADKREAIVEVNAAASREEEEGSNEEEVVMMATDSGVGLRASRGMLAGAAMLYGMNFGCVKLLEETVPMSLAAALRFTVATVPFLPFLVKTNPGVFRAGVEIGLLNAVGYWGQAKSLMTSTASNAAFICSLAVIVIPLVDAMFGYKTREEVEAARAIETADKKRKGLVVATLNSPWFPALLAVAGVACLELIGAQSRPSTGDVWALVQPLFFGVGFWLTERSARKYPGESLGIVAAHLSTVAVLAIGWCARAGQIPPSFERLHETVLPSSGSLVVPLSLLWVGLMTSSLTVFLETLAMENVSAAESTVILSTEPIWGTAFAAALLGETIGWNTGLGTVLIVLACTWSSVGPAIQSKLRSPVVVTV